MKKHYDFSKSVRNPYLSKAKKQLTRLRVSIAATHRPRVELLEPANALSRTRHGGGSGTDAFVAILNGRLDTLVYGTYLGGSDYEHAYGVAVNKGNDQSIFVVGDTSSTNFPQAGALQSPAGGVDSLEARVARLSPSGSGYTLGFSTYLGGSGDDIAASVAFDPWTGDIGVVGNTTTTNFPLANAFDSVLRGERDGFIARTARRPPPRARCNGRLPPRASTRVTTSRDCRYCPGGRGLHEPRRQRHVRRWRDDPHGIDP